MASDFVPSTRLNNAYILNDREYFELPHVSDDNFLLQCRGIYSEPFNDVGKSENDVSR